MRCKIILSLLLATVISSVQADEKLPTLQSGSTTYTNVTVTSVSATDVFFTHAGGMANVKIKELAPEWQQHFSFGRPKTKVVATAPTGNKTTPKPAPQPAATAAPTPPAATVLWRNDLPGALTQAQSEHKLVLIDFTGSDWCGWCKKFDQDVLSTAAFTDYASRKLMLVKLDFPKHTPQPAELLRANKALAQQFHVDGYPTFVLVNAEGKELGRQVGYLEGGPTAFTKQLDEFSR